MAFISEGCLGSINSQITERVEEMGALIKQDVKGELDVMFEMFRVDIGSLTSNSQEKQQVSERDLRGFANAADGRLVENNERNNKQEKPPGELSDAIVGLRGGEMQESRNNTQQIHEKQWKVEQRIEEEKVRFGGEIKKSIGSVQTQEDRQQGGD